MRSLPRAAASAKALLTSSRWLYHHSASIGVQTGGYYFGVIEIESTSWQEQKEIDVAVSASGWGAKANLSVSEKLEAVTKTYLTGGVCAMARTALLTCGIALFGVLTQTRTLDR